jgi:hypothetical protein
MPLFLSNSFGQTRLDLESPGPDGSINTLDTVTRYPSTISGTPTNEANPGPPKPFLQTYVPTNTYAENIRTNGSMLLKRTSGDETFSIFDATNLDTEKPGVAGGIPYNKLNDPTIYPVTTQKVDATTAGFNTVQGVGAAKFTQTYSANNPYFR